MKGSWSPSRGPLTMSGRENRPTGLGNPCFLTLFVQICLAVWLLLHLEVTRLPFELVLINPNLCIGSLYIQKLTVEHVSRLQTLQSSGASLNNEMFKVQVENFNILRARNWIYLFIYSKVHRLWSQMGILLFFSSEVPETELYQNKPDFFCIKWEQEFCCLLNSFFHCLLIVFQEHILKVQFLGAYL